MAGVCLVGAGRIGVRVAQRLAAAGHRVEAVDPDEGRRIEVEATGARWAGPSLGELTADRMLITVLPGSPELRELMLGPSDGSGRGALGRLAAGINWIDMTSAAPDLAADLAAESIKRGVRYVDAAVGGGPLDAARGELTLYVGGVDEDVQVLRPIFETFADPSRIFHMGAHGAGYLTKLLVNQLWFGQAVAIAEAMLLGADAGLSADRLADVLAAGPAASVFMERHLPSVLAGNYLPAFGLARVVEELDSLERMAQAAGMPWVVSRSVAEVHRQALAHFGAVDGELLGAAWLEYLAGRKLADPGA